MVEGPRYFLRMFHGDKEVGTSTVAITPDGQPYPQVGQTVGDWKITELLHNRPGEFWVRVVPRRPSSQ